MAIVGDMTRWQYGRVQQDRNGRASELIWHNGGHFADVDQRIAQGFIWLIEQGLIDTTPLITHTYKLAEIEAAYELFENRRDGVIKVAIETR